jgi:hypothetical protein
MASFRKNNKGEWVVFGTVAEVQPGKVMVEKKDGRRQPVIVSGLGIPFMANGQRMVYGYIAPKAPKAAPEVQAPKGAPMGLNDEIQAEMDWEARSEMAAELAAERAANDFCAF